MRGIKYGAVISALVLQLTAAHAWAGIDDYPTAISGCLNYPSKTPNLVGNLKGSVQDTLIDPWKEFNRECTSFAAWRLFSRNNFTMPFFGDAKYWKDLAQQRGYRTDTTPAIGAVAWFAIGHVAWVESYDQSTVTIEEYNYKYKYQYDEQTISRTSVSAFIHFHDLLAYPHPVLVGSSSPQIAITPAGRLTVLCRDASGSIWTIAQIAANSGWQSWQNLSGNVAGDPIPGKDYDGRLELFVRGNDGAIYNNWQGIKDGPWMGWGSFGGVLASNPTVSANGDGRLQFYVRGTDNHIYTKWQQVLGGNWSNWLDFGGSGVGDPFAYTHWDGKQEVFSLWTDSTVRSIWQQNVNGSWASWSSFGGNVAGRPVVGRLYDGRAQLFVRGKDGTIYTKVQTGSFGQWSSWSPFGNIVQMSSNPSVAYNAVRGQLSVSCIGSDGGVYLLNLPDDSVWRYLGAGFTNDPAVGINQDGRTEIFARGYDGVVYHSWQTPAGTWSVWTPLGPQ